MKNINPKVDVIAQLEFELIYFKAILQLLSHNTPRLNKVSWLGFMAYQP